MKATKEGKLIKTTEDILGNPKVQKTIKSMVKNLLPITGRTKYCFVGCGKEICECKPTNIIEMDKEKTAIQMLIEEIDNKLSGELTDTLRYSLEDCKNMANSLLQKEQEQIEKAFDLGVQSGMTKGYQNVGKDYYQSKYGGKDVDR